MLNYNALLHTILYFLEDCPFPRNSTAISETTVLKLNGSSIIFTFGRHAPRGGGRGGGACFCWRRLNLDEFCETTDTRPYVLNLVDLSVDDPGSYESLARSCLSVCLSVHTCERLIIIHTFSHCDKSTCTWKWWISMVFLRFAFFWFCKEIVEVVQSVLKVNGCTKWHMMEYLRVKEKEKKNSITLTRNKWNCGYKIEYASQKRYV